MKQNSYDKLEKNIDTAVTYSCIIAIVLVFIKTMQIFLYYNESIGLLNKSSFSTVLSIIISIGVVLILFAGFIIGTSIDKITTNEKVSTPPIISVSLLITGICFIIQGIFQFLNVNTLTKSLTIFCLLNSLLLILSGFSFMLIGYFEFKKTNNDLFFVKIIPLIWSIFSVFYILMTTPNIVSMQSDGSKVITAIITMLFLYFEVKSSLGYEHKGKTLFSKYIRLTFACLMLVHTLPYSIAFLFGFKDEIINMPYLAYLGLSFYGFLILFQYVVMSSNNIKKRKAQISHLNNQN